MSIHSTQVAALVQDIGNKAIIDGYAKHPPIYPQFCDVRQHDPRNEFGLKFTAYTGAGKFKETEEFEANFSDTIAKARSGQVKVREWTKSFQVAYRTLDAIGAVGKVGDDIVKNATMWGVAALRTKDDFVAGVLQYGTLTAGSTKYFDNSYTDNADPNAKFIFDGLPFFDTAHTDLAAATYSNHEPTGSLTAANLETYLNTMRSTNAVDDRGEVIYNEPDVLVVPPGLEQTAIRVIQSEFQPGSANNDVNAIRNRFKVVSNPFIRLAASASAGWLGTAGVGLFVVEDGIPVLTTTDDPIHRCVIVSAVMKYGAGVEDWRPWFNFGKAAA